MSTTRDTLLLVSTSYPQSANGSEAAGAFVADLAEEIARAMPVRVVAPGVTAGAMEQKNGVTVRRFAGPGRPLSLLSPASPADWPAIVATLRSLRAQTIAAGADARVIHTLALWTLPSGWAAAGLERKHGVPYSVWALGSDIWSLGSIPGVRQLLGKTARGARYRFADGIMLAKDAEQIVGMPFDFLPSTRVMTAPRSRRLNPKPPYGVLFLGRWHHNKGIDLLLEVLTRLSESDWRDIREVHIAGGGPLDSLVRQRVADLIAAGRPVRLSGFLDRAQAATALQAADFLLIPSRIESIPVVYSDAMQFGLPVISTPVGDLSSLIARHGCGIVAQSVDVDAYAAAMKQAFAIGPVEFSRGALAAGKEFDLVSIATRLRSLLGEMAND